MNKNIWFVSDTHFGHGNVLKYCNRPFSSTLEHDQQLIANWNSVVKENDTVYHLGDFGLSHPRYLLKVAFDKDHIIFLRDVFTRLP